LVTLGGRYDAEGERPRGSFLTLRGVISLFRTPRVVLVGWIHFLAFDLFVGASIAVDAERVGISHCGAAHAGPDAHVRAGRDAGVPGAAAERRRRFKWLKRHDRWRQVPGGQQELDHLAAAERAAFAVRPVQVSGLAVR
jgi:hypothetical protein